MVARGCYQQDIYTMLVNGEAVSSPSRHLKGNAARYAGRYAASFANLLGRMAEVGMPVQRTPGKLGGEWGATYRLVGVK
jgi:hypothetical protein